LLGLWSLVFAITNYELQITIYNEQQTTNNEQRPKTILQILSSIASEREKEMLV